jgi:hypothetical protein
MGWMSVSHQQLPITDDASALSQQEESETGSTENSLLNE